MDDQSLQNEREKLILQYIEALETGNNGFIAEALEAAMKDPVLDSWIGDVNCMLLEEKGLSVSTATWKGNDTKSISSTFKLFHFAPIRYAVAACLAIVLVYSSLWLIGKSLTPPTFQLAYVGSIPVERTPMKAPSNYELGIQTLSDSYESIIGLFPRYNLARAEEAVFLLEQAYQTTSDPFKRAEISYFLAKAYLMQNDVDSAKSVLNRAISQKITPAYNYVELSEDLLKQLNEISSR